MKTLIPKALAVLMWGATMGLAHGEVPLALPASPLVQETAPMLMPRLSFLPPGPIDGRLIDQTVMLRTLPGLNAESGRRVVMRRLADDPMKRAHAIGHLAEDDFVYRNPAYRKTLSPNAPQNDVWTFFRGELHGGQIKTHRDGDAAQYIRDMFEDDKAEHFLVPDDHFPAIELKLKQQLSRANTTADAEAATDLRRQLGRLRKLGRTYGELDQALVTRTATVISQSNALRVTAGGALATFPIDGVVVLYRSESGKLTPTQTVQELIEAGVKATATGGVMGTAVLLGADPVGFTVIVVAGVTYVVVDYAVQELRSSYASTPMNKARIEQILPEGWHLREY